MSLEILNEQKNFREAGYAIEVYGLPSIYIWVDYETDYVLTDDARFLKRIFLLAIVLKNIFKSNTLNYWT